MASQIRIRTTDQREYIIRLRALLEETVTGEQLAVDPELWSDVIEKTEALVFEETATETRDD